MTHLTETLGTADINPQSSPHDKLFERLRQYDGPPCVIILDEADRFEEQFDATAVDAGDRPFS